MTISAICTKSVATVNRNATAADATISMRSSHVGALVVADQAGEVRKTEDICRDEFAT